jgi:dienelactone hydrolase
MVEISGRLGAVEHSERRGPRREDCHSVTHSRRCPGLLALLGSFYLAACGITDRPATPIAETGSNVATGVSAAGLGAEPTFESASKLGPYRVQNYTDGMAVPERAPYSTPMIYYPQNGRPPYPGIVFVPGHGDVYLEDPPLLTQWGTFLASHGFVILFVNPSDLDTGPVGRTEALKAAMDLLAAENDRPGGPLNAQVDTARMAVMGHSYGGAGALFATNSNTDARLKAAVALSPVPGNNGPSYPTDTVPSLLIEGVGDIYADVNIQAQYRSIPATTPKYLARYARTPDVILNSMHLIAHAPLGGHPQDPSVARLGLAFFEVYLAGDQRYARFLIKDPVHMSSFQP